ncbi:Universal stress protein A-like protein [Sesamum angolense]|uniref:Universal stress protein A-like protein n=1 Tax=Sesamum angolense TaxID=2727404 RepID=A0AAE1T5U1_9LAMI|nr:Universal stress protein A-like protein [Sesamum angolense]
MEGATTGSSGTAEERAMNVLVAIDDSDESFHALQWVLDKILKRSPVTEAAAPESSRPVVTIVHVVESLARYAFHGGHVVDYGRKEQEQNAARILSRAFEICRDKLSLNAKTLILEGDPKDKICRAVEEMDINLLVVGSRGLADLSMNCCDDEGVSGECERLLRPPCKMSSFGGEAATTTTGTGRQESALIDASSSSSTSGPGMEKWSIYSRVFDYTDMADTSAGTAVEKMRVMVAIDESDESFYALHWVLHNLFPPGGVVATHTHTQTHTHYDDDNSNSNSNTTIMLTLICHGAFSSLRLSWNAGRVSDNLGHTIRTKLKKKLHPQCSQALHMCAQRMVKAKTCILEGDPKEMICDVAEQMQMDLIAVGSRGLGKIKRAFMGSVSDYVTHHAKCPVLVIKQPSDFQK